MSDDRGAAGKARNGRKKAAEELPFEKALDRLQEIVETLESGSPSLEQSLKLFEEGVALSRRCNRRLDEAERRLEILVRKTDGGDAVEALPEEDFFPAEAGGEDERS